MTENFQEMTFDEFLALGNDTVIFPGEWQPKAGEVKLLVKIIKGLKLSDEKNYCLNLLTGNTQDEVQSNLERYEKFDFLEEDNLALIDPVEFKSAIYKATLKGLALRHDEEKLEKGFNERFKNLNDAVRLALELN